MDKEQIHIVGGGMAKDTKITGPDGKPLPGVMNIEIKPIEPMGSVVVVVTFGNVAFGPVEDKA